MARRGAELLPDVAAGLRQPAVDYLAHLELEERRAGEAVTEGRLDPQQRVIELARVRIEFAEHFVHPEGVERVPRRVVEIEAAVVDVPRRLSLGGVGVAFFCLLVNVFIDVSRDVATVGAC